MVACRIAAKYGIETLFLHAGPIIRCRFVVIVPMFKIVPSYGIQNWNTVYCSNLKCETFEYLAWKTNIFVIYRTYNLVINYTTKVYTTVCLWITTTYPWHTTVQCTYCTNPTHPASSWLLGPRPWRRSWVSSHAPASYPSWHRGSGLYHGLSYA